MPHMMLSFLAGMSEYHLLYVALLELCGMRLIGVALVNDFHFWALTPANQDEDETLDESVVEYPQQQLDPWYSNGVAAELALVSCLSGWKPFDQPTPELVESLRELSAQSPCDTSTGARGRQLAVMELTKQDEAYQVTCLRLFQFSLMWVTYHQSLFKSTR